MYQQRGVAAPVGMADFETARVHVWVPGHGWAERTEDDLAAVRLAETVDALDATGPDECQGAA